MNTEMAIAQNQQRSISGIIEYTVAVELNFAFPICPIYIHEWDYRKRLRLLFFANGKEFCIDHTYTCPLYIGRNDGQLSSVEPMPYTDGTNCLVYEFTEFFGEVPGTHYLWVTFREKSPDEKDAYMQLTTPEIPLEVIDGPFTEADLNCIAR